MAMNNLPRPATDTEEAELLSLLLDGIATDTYGIDEEELANVDALVDSAHIAIFENCTADRKSGYAGKLMSVVWSIDPTKSDVFGWRNGMLEESGRTSVE